MTNSIFIAFAKNNLWSNYRLYKTCRLLSDDEYKATRPSFFGSIHATLNHILIVDLIYLGRLTGQSLVALHCKELESNICQLANRQVQTDRELIDFVERQNADTLGMQVSFCRENGQCYKETITNLLMHLFTHQMHHRGQVHDMLSQTSVSPPQLDEFFLNGDFQLRVDELSELGLPCC